MNVDSMQLSETVWSQLAAVVGPGDERCGIVYGVQQRVEGVRTAVVVGTMELANAASDQTHQFEFGPEEQLSAWEQVAAANERYEVLGVWHTHPGGPEEPSTTDLANMQPWLLYPVLWPGVNGPAMQAYKLSPVAGTEEAAVVQIGLTVVPDAVHEETLAAANAA